MLHWLLGDRPNLEDWREGACQLTQEALHKLISYPLLNFSLKEDHGGTFISLSHNKRR